MGFSSFMNDISDRRAMRAFEALSSKREEEELLSWQRALEISHQLSASADPQTARLAKELEKIAQEKVSYAQSLGFESNEAQTTLASGMVFSSATMEQIACECEEDDALEEPSWNEISAGRNSLPELLEPAAPSLKREMATFKHVVDSRDGKLSLFEDAQGHLIAVRTSRLV